MTNGDQEEVKVKDRIIVEFRNWAKTNVATTRADRLVFFNYLQREKPDPLTFRWRGLDKWQQVNAWLSKAHVLN